MDRLWYAFAALAACSGPELAITSAQAPPSRALEVTTMSVEPAACASPPTLRNVPPTTRGFAVIASDREMPRWAVPAIPANENLFARRCGDYPHDGEGPCDQVIGRRGIPAPELLDAIEGHVVARGTLAMTFD